MEILLLVGSWGNAGGIERHAAVLTHTLRETEWRPLLVVPATEKSPQLQEWLRTQGVEAITSKHFVTPDQSHTPGYIRNLTRALREWKPDAVSLHYRDKMPLADALAARLAGIKVVVASVHCVPYPTRARRQAYKLLTRLVDCYVVHARPVARALIGLGIPATKIVYMPYGLRPPAVVPQQWQARLNLKIPLDAFVVGCHARLQPEKGIDNIIEAVATMPSDQEALYLLIAGTGPELSRLQSFVDQRQVPYVRFLGQLNGAALCDFYAALDVFALAPEWEEAFGLVFIEAAQFGVPSVSWRVGGIEDAVVHEKTGLLAEAGDLTGLTSAIARLRRYGRLRDMLGRGARVHANTRFAADQLGANFATLMGQLYRNHRPGNRVAEDGPV